MSAKTIHQEVTFKADPKKVYDSLLDAKTFAAFTGAPATIDAKVGGAISGFGGMITGINVELVPGKRIVQAWRAGNWPEGIHSIVAFNLAPAGTGTKLTLDHSGAPDGSEEMLEGGWHKMYWEPLSKHLA
jgi:activator of HSP90 ATPase